MAFLDLKKTKQRGEDAIIEPHPLKGKLSTSVATSYLNAIVFAGLVDDEEFSDIEFKYGRMRALSLGMTSTDFDDAVKTVRTLKSDDDKQDFLGDMLASFSDRDVALYVTCDMARAMMSDGALTEDATTFLDAVYDMLRLSAEDKKFLVAYREAVDSAHDLAYDDKSRSVIQRFCNAEFPFPDAFVDFFASTLNSAPVPLEDVRHSEKEFSVCKGTYTLDSELIVRKGTKLTLRDAEILFRNQNARLVLSGGTIEIENCRFLAQGTDGLECPKSTPMIQCDALTKCVFRKCTFDGALERRAVYAGMTDLTFEECVFTNLKTYDGNIIHSDRCVTCTSCSFKHNSCPRGHRLLHAADFTLTKCEVIDCWTSGSLFCWCGEYGHNFKFESCVLRDCSANEHVVGCFKSSFSIESKWGFFECCFVHVWYGRERAIYTPAYTNYTYTTKVDCLEDEVRKSWNEKTSGSSGKKSENKSRK